MDFEGPAGILHLSLNSQVHWNARFLLPAADGKTPAPSYSRVFRVFERRLVFHHHCRH